MRAVCYLLLIVVQPLVAQPSYVVKYSLPASTMIRRSQLTADGGLVIAGGVDSSKHYVSRLDPTGNLQWLRLLRNGRSFGVDCLPDGRIIVAGHIKTWNTYLISNYAEHGYLILDDATGSVSDYGTSVNSIRNQSWSNVLALPSGEVVLTGSYRSLFGSSGIIYRVDLETGVELGDGFYEVDPLNEYHYTGFGRARQHIDSGFVVSGGNVVARYSDQIELQWYKYFDGIAVKDFMIDDTGEILLAAGDKLIRLTAAGDVDQVLGVPASMGSIMTLQAGENGSILFACEGQDGVIRWGQMDDQGVPAWLEEWGEPGMTYAVKDLHRHPDGRLTIVAQGSGVESLVVVLTTDPQGLIEGCSAAVTPGALIPSSVDMMPWDITQFGGTGPDEELITFPQTPWYGQVDKQCENGFGRLSGTVYLDESSNGTQDGQDPAVSMLPVIREPADQMVFSTPEGYGTDVVSSGQYTLTLLFNDDLWELMEGAGGHVVNISTVDTIIDDLNFGLVPIIDTVDVVAGLTSAFTRCWDTIPQQIDLVNMGTVTTDVFVVLELDSLIDFVSAVPPQDSIVGNTIFWHIEQLAPFGMSSIQLLVGMPGVDFLGTQLQSTVSTSYMDDGGVLVPAGVPYDWSSTLACAVDPNDKLVEPRGYSAAGWIPPDTEWLTYTVRFQNTGTDTAFTVVIHDQLDTYVDHTSLQLLGTSHPLTQLEISGGGLAAFHFDNILLPDSGTNGPASHGYVRFRVRVAEGATHTTSIRNDAGIYFDLNPPIVTNTVRNTLVDCQVLEDALGLVGPNQSGLLEPSQGWNNPINWLYLSGNTYAWYLDGELLPPVTWMNDTLPWIYVDAPGTYQLVITTVFGCVITAPPYVNITTGAGENDDRELRAFPVPFRDELLVSHPGHFDRVELIDVNGRVVLAHSVNTPGSQRIERRDLASGLYLLRLINEGSVVAAGRVVAE